jgi:uncharacterized protein with PQ loop repeat
MSDWMINIIGWIPGIIFPGASALQLFTLYRSKSSAGVSAVSWALFAIANVAAYIYLEKYWEPQALAYLLAGALQVVIVFLAVSKKPKMVGSE